MILIICAVQWPNGKPLGHKTHPNSAKIPPCMSNVAQTDLDQGHFFCCFLCFGGPVSPGYAGPMGVCALHLQLFSLVWFVSRGEHTNARMPGVCRSRILHTERWPLFFIFNSVVKMLMFYVSVISPLVSVSFQSINSSHASQGKDIKMLLSSDLLRQQLILPVCPHTYAYITVDTKIKKILTSSLEMRSAHR